MSGATVPCRAKPGIEHGEVDQPDADAAKAERESGRLALRQHERSTGLREPRDQPARSDLVEHGDGRHVQRQLQRPAHGDRALDR